MLRSQRNLLGHRNATGTLQQENTPAHGENGTAMAGYAGSHSARLASSVYGQWT